MTDAEAQADLIRRLCAIPAVYNAIALVTVVTYLTLNVRDLACGCGSEFCPECTPDLPYGRRIRFAREDA